ncbi:hypothetical protein GCM10010156_76330 [Planobispora rosea]|uniref:Uncharacterized protein n=1 Tax=Planobispora rosea TaxID=35762 RepID=A0A8J3SAR2_PLARO|nr:hypothetical protein [Planobispora rosea]GGT07953.1 hypothetical protein GCM10010156_76330 [Planobispora rosea]GIH89170.1 hypothetical protein Pro02_75780 [Planobispora rosea]
MNRTKRLAAVAAISTAVAGGLAFPVAAWAAEPTPSASSSTSSGSANGTSSATGERGPRGGHGMRGLHGLDAAGLAEALGVEEAEVTAALEELRADGTGRPAEDATAEEREAARTKMIESLADKLGVTADKITAAMDTLRLQRAAEAEAALSERLSAAVTAGTITQAEADAVLKAHKAGLLQDGPRGGKDTDTDDSTGTTRDSAQS